MKKNYNDKQRAKTAKNDWPGAFGIYKTSRDAIRLSLGTVIAMWLLDIGLTFLIDYTFPRIIGQNFGTLIGDILGFVLSAFFVTAQVYIYITSVRGERVEFDEGIKVALPLWGRMILLDLAIILTVVGGLILLIVPGIIFALRLSQAPYFLVDENMEVMDAYKASWDATKGNLGKIWGIIGVYILMAIPAITIIGIILTVYLTLMYGAAYAVLYNYISKKKSAPVSRKKILGAQA